MGCEMKRFLEDLFWFIDSHRHNYGYKMYQKLQRLLNLILDIYFIRYFNGGMK